VPSVLANIFLEAAKLNADDPRLEGNVLHLGAGRDVIVAGDLHGHRANLARIIAYADLANHADRVLVLQEIVHAPPEAQTGLDRSMDCLLRAARLKIARPEQLVFLLGNHDVAQAMGNEITKSGRGVCRSFVEGVRHAVGEADAPGVLEAINAFLLSAPIAARCPGGVLLCHTLPTPQRMALAGQSIPAGPYRPEDLRRGGAVYEWVWGRNQTAEQVERLAQRLGVAFFVLAHRRIETPCEMVGPKALILTAEHERGAVLQFSSDTALTEATAAQCLRPIAGLDRGR
jgi:hypothetical protein